MLNGETVTILLAAHNGERYLREQLDSILRQNFGGWRLIASDDGSTDRSPQILDDYARRFPGRIRVLSHDLRFGNARDHFFYLLQHCEGRYIMFCDQDDLWLPDKIRITLTRMRAAEAGAGADTPVLVHTDLAVTDRNLRIRAKSFFSFAKLDWRRSALGNLLVQNIVTGCTVMVNRPLLNRMGEPPRRALMHDWWLALVASAFGRVEFIHKPTVLYRQHGRNQVGAHDAGSPRYLWERLRNVRRLKEGMSGTYAQAAEFVLHYGDALTPEQKKMLDAYLAVPFLHKPERVAVLARRGFLKKGWLRAAGQLWLS
jgi:glycosyltransferase involved in cell wall biosynthesis